MGEKPTLSAQRQRMQRITHPAFEQIAKEKESSQRRIQKVYNAHTHKNTRSAVGKMGSIPVRFPKQQDHQNGKQTVKRP